MGAKQVFVVNDDPTTLGPTDTTMKSRGYETLTFDSLAMALAILDHSVPDLVILDNLQRSSNEIQLIRQIREISNVPIVVVNEHRDAAARVEALTLGADAYLTKPFGGEELVARAEAILRRASDSDRRTTGAATITYFGMRPGQHCRVGLFGTLTSSGKVWSSLYRPPNWRAKDTDVLFGAKFDGMASASNISPVVPRGTKARPN